MENKKKKGVSVALLAQVAVLVAIMLVMQLTGINSLRIGPLKMSFMTLPVAIGAMLVGPGAGAILGAVFGLLSFWSAVSGTGGLTTFFFQYKPFSTFMLCVGMRVLMGFFCGLIFKLVSKLDRDEKTWSFFVGAISAPLLNTIFFMGYIILFFYNMENVQALVESYGAANPLHFVILLVGVQGLVEAVAVCIIGGILTKVLSKVVKNYMVKR
ncbi:MAG: ECF transporter S component [Firmicutes bacterium]|nr:ECF transporter S component [Bacillota bacterium]